MTKHAVTANLLGEGKVAFLTWDGGWSEHVAESFVASSEEESEWLLEIARRAVDAQIVVDPYLIEVTDEGGSAWPVKRRERIRATGPTFPFAPEQSQGALRRVA